MEQKGKGRANSLAQLELRHPSPLALEYQHSWFLDSDWDLYHQPPNSYMFEPKLNYITSFLGSLVCRQQIVGLLDFHDYVSQFLYILCILLVLFL